MLYGPPGPLKYSVTILGTTECVLTNKADRKILFLLVGKYLRTFYKCRLKAYIFPYTMETLPLCLLIQWSILSQKQVNINLFELIVYKREGIKLRSPIDYNNISYQSENITCGNFNFKQLVTLDFIIVIEDWLTSWFEPPPLPSPP